jgi:predicted CxxxxCH...CXXCH cytochrome family protein
VERTHGKTVFFIVIIIILAIAQQIYGLDFPHYGINNISCDSCHFVYGDEPSLLPPWTAHTPQDIDDTQYNTLCWSCHNDIDAPYVRTHSSLNTSDKYGDADADGQPGWSMECRKCHDPHTQKQLKIYTGESYLYSGISTDVTTTSITQSGANWTVDEYKDLIVVPNTSKPNYNYKILSNTSDTLNVKGPIDLSKVTAGDTFAIIYGKLIKSTIATPNSGNKSVRFFKTTGTNSFADGDTTYDGICEVCHTQTLFHRNNVSGDHAHNPGVKCTTCHLHTEGFKGSGCDVCHGYPPIVDSATGGPDGLVNYNGTTGSTTAGAHNTHVNTKNFTCTVCHFNSAGSGSTHNNGLVITLGFSPFGGSYQGGSYDGQSGVNYDTTLTTPPTTVSNTGTKTCSNIYCHSTGQSTIDENDPTPAYASPVWDDPSTGTCGTCHKVTEASGLISGSHAEHLGTQGVNGCGDCHTGAANDASSYDSPDHVNGAINVANSYTAGGDPGNGYGTCSTAPCHDDGTGNLVITPTWGTDVPDCTACHEVTPNSGSHPEHLSVGKTCSDCHDGAVEGVMPPEQHLDGNIDVYDSVSGDLGYPENKGKGTAYASCVNIYCHGYYNGSGLNASPTWGNPADGACGTCHGASNTSYPASGSHERHAGDGLWTGDAGSQNNREYSCTLCHKGIVGGTGPASYTIADPTRHVNQTVDWEFDTTDSRLSVLSTYSIPSGTQPPSDGTIPRAYGTCNNVYCHSNVQPDGGVGDPDLYTTPTWGTETKCFGCHTDTVTYPDPNSYDQGLSRHTKMTSGSHSKHILSSNPVECLTCHDWAGLTAFLSGCRSTLCHGGTGEKLYHVNGSVELIFGSYLGPNATYNGTPTPGDGYSNCSNIYCHSDGTSIRTGDNTFVNTTPEWGGPSLACNSCHGNTSYPSPNDGMPDYPNGSPKENSHKEHVIDNSIGCGRCHWQTTQDGMSISNPAAHTKGSYTLWPNGDFKGIPVSFTYAPASISSPGTCGGISCHGGNSATWGGTLTCDDCHLGTGDVDDYTSSNGTIAKIDSTEWNYSGHGKTSGTYDVSGNPAANLSCDYCHDESVPHETSTNPFRLANYNALGNGWNDTCYICHKTDSAGYDPGTGLKNSTVKVDKYHYGSKHGASNDGGSLCWDCHDPHGDRTSGSGNIYMIHSSVTKDKSDAYGTPTSTASVSFISNSTGTDYARSSSPFDGICNVCHTSTNHYTSTSGDGHNSGTVCTLCHFHSEDTVIDGNAFAPTGDCIACHAEIMANTRRKVTGTSGDFVKTSHHVTDGTTTEIVTEEACMVCHGDLYSIGHPGTAPADPQVELMDQDSGIISVYDISTSAGALEPFCLSCHDSDGSLQHGAQPFSVSGDTNSPPDIGWTSGVVSHSSLTDVCFGCHGNSGGTPGDTINPVINAHGSDISYLLRYSYTQGASHDFCYNCHDGTVASTDIQSLFARTYNHSTADCLECHNQHAAEPGTHTEGTNLVSGVLTGVTGVEPVWTGSWTAPDSFTVVTPAVKEYQICFKCHSAYPGSSVSTTDQALEFNPDNKSAHPVVVSLNNQTGSYSPKALDLEQMKTPWTDVGNQTMYCSDCHGAGVSDPKGPHGSDVEFMLTGANQYWPASSTGKLFSLNDISGRDKAESPYNGLNTNWANEIFCLNCHDSFPSSDRNTWKNEAHREHDDRSYSPTSDNKKHNVYCIACHSIIPHGSHVSRLIIYNSDAPAYNTYNGINYNVIRGFRKVNRLNYNEKDCWTVQGFGCDKHKSGQGSYD